MEMDDVRVSIRHIKTQNFLHNWQGPPVPRVGEFIDDDYEVVEVHWHPGMKKIDVIVDDIE